MAGIPHTLRTSGLTEKFHLDYQKYAQASSEPHACTKWEKKLVNDKGTVNVPNGTHKQIRTPEILAGLCHRVPYTQYIKYFTAEH
jgi:hypothetical protein